MDVISSAAAIAGLAEAGARATGALKQYISRVKKAKSSCEELLKRIELMSAAEKAIKTTVQGPSPSLPGYSPELQNLINTLFEQNGPMNKCNLKAKLDELSAWLGSYQAENSRYKRLIMKMGWPTKEDKIEETIKAFDQYMPYFNLIQSLMNRDTVVNALAVSMKVEHATSKSELLTWFGGFNCTKNQEFYFRKRKGKTGEWLFKEELYKTWRAGSTKFIWLHGKPGAGKSVLASAVIGDLLSPPNDNEPLAYFYCNFRDASCTSAEGVLRSLTMQLLCSSKKEWLSSFSDLITRKERGAGPPTDPCLLLDLLKRAAAFHERPVMVVDALDECDDKDLPNLLDALIELVHADYRLFVTSRTLLVIENAFSDLSAIFLGERVDEVQEDIRLYIGVMLESQSRLKDLDQAIKDDIQSDLMKKADGMFQWVQCQLDQLNSCCSIGDIYKVLRTLPKTLHRTYDKMLDAIDEKPFGPRIARRALMWLVTALQPLGFDQLVDALTLSSDEPAWDSTHAPLDERVILEILGSFVVIDHTDGIVTLSHHSIKEYLTSDTLAYTAYYVHLPDASLELAKASIFALILHHCSDNDLSFYADCRGLQHLKDCDAAHNEALVKHLLTLQDHIFAGPFFDELLRASMVNPWMTRVRGVALYIILRYGHLSMLSHYLDHHPIQATAQDNPLVFAACYSSIAGVQLLLDKGLDVNREGFMYNFYRFHRISPLIAAARHEDREYQEPLVRFFLENRCVVPRSAICAILWSGWSSPCNPSVVRVLLGRGADPKLWDTRGRSCLHLLFESHGISLEDKLEIAQILVDGGCDPAALSDKGPFPLISGARNSVRGGQERIVQFLLDNGCTVPTNAVHATLSPRRCTPCNPAVVRALLACGADPTLLVAGNESSLHLLFESRGISCEDRLEIAQILVDKGCDPTALNDQGYSPLVAAARNAMREKQECFVQCLLPNRRTVPVNAIHATLSPRIRGPYNPAVVRALVTHGADPKLLVAENNSSLHLLFESTGISPEDRLEIAQVLVENGCNPVTLNDRGRLPFHHVILHVHHYLDKMEELHPMLRFLVEKGTPPNSQDEDGCNAIHLLCKNKDTLNYEPFAYTLQLLVEFRCNINSRNKDGKTPFHLAVPCPYSSRVVDLFISQGAEIPVDIVHHLVAYDHPYGRDEREVIAALTKLKGSRASFQSRTKDGGNPLHCLLQPSASDTPKSILAIALFLIESGCDIHASYDGVTPLELAIENGQFPVAEALLARVTSGPGSHSEHAELFHDDDAGNSILCRLCWKGNFMEKVEFLQEAGYNLTKDINRQNYDGITPLCAFLSQFYADPEMVTESLLALGASFNYVNYVYPDNIQWASNLSWYPDAADAHKRYISRSNISCNDVVLVQHLLRARRRRLTSAVINSILDMGEYWACMKVVEYDIRYDETTRRDKHVAFSVIPGEMAGWIPRRVVFSYKSNTKLSGTSNHDAVVFSRLYVTRGGTKFRVPKICLVLPNLPRTGFTVWSEFRPALHEDGEQKIMLEELLPGDILSVEFEYFPQDNNYAVEFLQMDVYYSINSLSDECN